MPGGEDYDALSGSDAVSKKESRNIAGSVRQRLLNKARMDKRPFNELLQYYAMERFLYRLSRSSYAHTFILKGALMLRAWQVPISRSTMDIDMLGKTGNEVARIEDQIRDICSVQVEPDGLDLIWTVFMVSVSQKMLIMKVFAYDFPDSWILPRSPCKSTLDSVILSFLARKKLNFQPFSITLRHVWSVTAGKVQSQRNLKP